MISRFGFGRSGLLILAAGFGLAVVPMANAQTPPAEQDPQAASAEAATPGVDDADVKALELDWSQLNVDASALPTGPASKARSPKATAPPDASWSSRDNRNGSAAVSVKQALSPFWDARIGADMTVTRQGSTPTASDVLSEKVANGGNLPQSSGTAWMAVTAPGVGAIWDNTAVEARVDPTQERSKVGATMSKSLPLSGPSSVTLQNGYNVVEQGTVPMPGGAPRPALNYETEQSAKLSIGDTGTSFVAGQTLSSADDKWLRKWGAEQKLFDGVSISGSIGETPQGTTNKSLTAGFKRSW
jgi:hypothetical protein